MTVVRLPIARHRRKLAALAREITSELESGRIAARTSLEHAIKAGELLTRAKDLLPHGEFTRWAQDNCGGLSIRSAQGYMRLHRERLALSPDMPIRDALRMLAEAAEPESETTIKLIQTVTTHDCSAVLGRLRRADEAAGAARQEPAANPQHVAHSAPTDIPFRHVIEERPFRGVVYVTRELEQVESAITAALDAGHTLREIIAAVRRGFRREPIAPR